jgi:hypothetical protein
VNCVNAPVGRCHRRTVPEGVAGRCSRGTLPLQVQADGCGPTADSHAAEAVPRCRPATLGRQRLVALVPQLPVGGRTHCDAPVSAQRSRRRARPGTPHFHGRSPRKWFYNRWRCGAGAFCSTTVEKDILLKCKVADLSAGGPLMSFCFKLDTPTPHASSGDHIGDLEPLEDAEDYEYLIIRGCADLARTDARFNIGGFGGCGLGFRYRVRHVGLHGEPG